MLYSKLESIRYESEGQLIPIELNGFLLSGKSQFVHLSTDKTAENLSDTILPSSILFPTNKITLMRI